MYDGDGDWSAPKLRNLSLAEREALVQRALQRGRDERSRAAGALLDRLVVALRGWASHRLARRVGRDTARTTTSDQYN